MPAPLPPGSCCQAILDSTGRFGGSPALSKQELFSLSLITEVPPGARLLRCFKETAEEAAAATVARGRRTLSGTASAASGAPLLAAGGGASQVCYGPSPFPQLEAFISTICREVGGWTGGPDGGSGGRLPLVDAVMPSGVQWETKRH